MAGLEKPQTQGIQHHADGAQTHGRRTEHGVQLPVQGRVEHACRQGDAKTVVTQGPEKIFLNIADNGAAQAHGSRHVPKIPLHEDDVSGFDGDVSPRSDSQPHVRPRQSRSVVDTVANHGNPAALFLQAADLLFLAVGKNLGDDSLNAGLLPDSLGCPGAVTGEHDYGKSQFFHFRHRLGAGGLYGIRRRDQAGYCLFIGKIKNGLALAGQLLRPEDGIQQADALLLHQLTVARKPAATFQYCFDAPAGNGAECLRLRQGQALFLCGPDYRLGQRVLRTALHGRRKPQKLLRATAQRDEIGDLGRALGDGAGLVQHHGVHQVSGLQGLAGFDQDAVFCAFPRPHHDGSGCCQAQCAGTGNHQDRNADGDGKGCAVSKDQPDQRRYQGDSDDDGDKNAADPVRQLGYGSF